MEHMTMDEWRDASPVPKEALEQERLFQRAAMVEVRYQEGDV